MAEQGNTAFSVPQQTASKRAASVSFWHQRRYASWMTADTTLRLAGALTSYAQPLIVFALSRSLELAGTVSTVAMLVTLVCMPFGGTLVDRHDRRRMMMLHAAAGAAIWALAAVLLALGRLNTPMFLVLTFIAVAVKGLMSEASDAMLRELVHGEQYAKARSVNEGRDATLDLLGGPLGGLLYGLGQWVPYVASMVSFIVGGVAAFLTGRPRPQASGSADGQATGRASRRRDRSFFADLAEGFRFVVSHKRLRLLTLLLCVSNFPLLGIQMGGELQLIHVHASPFVIGLLSSCVGGAALVGAALSTMLIGRMPTGAVIITSMVLPTLAMLPLVFVQSLPVLFVCVTLAVLATPMSSASVCGYVFAQTPDEFQGRVSSLVSVVSVSLGALSPAVASVLIERFGFGVLATVLVSLAAVCAVVALCSDGVRSIPKPQRWDEAAL
ncbi:MFS transporter [Bifidobacterium leontopitheci]|uniref:MFS transporter n=1 Tax=Bifidobacterium leontopitheci TaxID=2650774 RepID=A0A6I1GPD3_9BIFI|nr:MFS transporter [Bifidobacterium leontopitheci]KAB7791147.1 MFS transporter [Bifidobacterium leontopitheci]